MATTAHTSTLYATELRLRPVVLAAHAASVAAVVATLALTGRSVLALMAAVPVLSNQLYLHKHNGRTTIGMAPLSLTAIGLASLAALMSLQLHPLVRTLCIVAIATAAAVALVHLVWFARIRSCYRLHPVLEPNAALIVLGGAIRHGRPCTTLARRLDVAARLAHEYPCSIIVPSGGPVPDHSTTEAEAMAIYLQERGVAPDRIIPETAALNTQQNIANSCALLDARGSHTQRCVVSSDYHLWRALRDAQALGIELTPIPAPTPLTGKAQQWCREVLTILVGRR